MRSNRAGRTSKKRRNWICYPIPFFMVKRAFGYRPASSPLSPPVYIPIKLSPLLPFFISQDTLGSGLVIFKGRKTGYAGGTEVSPVPCFIFPKVRWSVSNRSFPVLTVFPVWMTGVSSAALSTSSSTDFSGRMHLMSTAPTKRCTIALSSGAGSVFSIKFSLSWQIKHLLMLPDDRLHPSQGSPHGGKPAQKGDSPRLIGRTKGGLNSKLHIVCDGHGRPVLLLLAEGQVNDYKGAAIL